MPWIIESITFPDGAEFKANYSGETYYAKVSNGALSLDGKRFKSPSEAAKHITGYQTKVGNFGILKQSVEIAGFCWIQLVEYRFSDGLLLDLTTWL